MANKEGWGWLVNARKYHYFRNHRSLCGRWGLLDDRDLSQGDDDSPDNCVHCRQALKGDYGKQKTETI